MLFKTTALVTEYFGAHPNIREVLRELNRQVDSWGFPPLTLTDVLRDASFYRVPKFSWHFCGCAVDVRTHGYDAEQKALVYGWLLNRCPKSGGWDVLLENEGRPEEHLHVEFEDSTRRREYEQHTGQSTHRGTA